MKYELNHQLASSNLQTWSSPWFQSPKVKRTTQLQAMINPKKSTVPGPSQRDDPYVLQYCLYQFLGL